MDVIFEPWPWYVAGPLIGLMVPLLLLLGNRQFGMSAAVQDFCAWCLKSPKGYFHFDAQKSAWRLWFSLGVAFAGFTIYLLDKGHTIALSDAAMQSNSALGLSPTEGYYPKELLGSYQDFGVWQAIYLLIAGILVGFGTRMAGGCTSGHSIMGLAQFNPASLVATIGFFAGGLAMTHLAFPHFLPWLLHG